MLVASFKGRNRIMGHNDIMAAWMAVQYQDEDEAGAYAPDHETERLAREAWRRGTEVLKAYSVHCSERFPLGADLFGGRLKDFVSRYGLIAWTEVDAGYIATSQQRCYIGLAERS
jgi:hypothetical protein